MAVSLRHATEVVASQNPDRAVSKEEWNEEHEIVADPDTFLTFDASGLAVEQPLGALGPTLVASEDAAAARATLGLGSAALLAATAVLQVANDLGDLADPAVARTNLGLGTAAEANTADLITKAEGAADSGGTLIKHKIAASTTTYGRSVAALKALGADDSDGVSVMHFIDPDLDDELLAGTNAVNLQPYLTNAVDAMKAVELSTGRRLHLTVPPLIYLLSDALLLDCPNLTLSAHGATFQGTRNTGAPSTLNIDQPARVVGLRCENLGGGTSYNVNVSSADVRLGGMEMVTPVDYDGIQLYVRDGSHRFRLLNSLLSGTNEGVVIFSSDDWLLAYNDIIGAASLGGDDGVVLKAADATMTGGLMLGNRMKYYGAMLAIGSQVGLGGGSDPSPFSKYVHGIQVLGNHGKECTRLLYLKPGSVSSVNYHDGEIAGLDISHNRLSDPTGARLQIGVDIVPGRGSRVRDIKGRDNKMSGRSYDDGSATRLALRCMNADMTGSSPGCNQPNISDIDIGIMLIDPHDGAAAGGSSPGSPFQHIAEIKNQSAGHGTMSDIALDLEGNGAANSGIAIGAGLDDVVALRRAHLSNINTSGGASGAGIRSSSRIHLLTDDIKISMSSGNPYEMVNGTTAEIVGRADHIFFAEQVNAGNDENKRPWASPRNAFVHRVDVLHSNAIALSADDTNYTQWEFRNLGGTTNVFASTSSKLTGGQALGANTFNTCLRARDITNATNQGDCFFPRGSMLQVGKNDFGTGNTVTDAYVRIHWAPY